MNIDFWINLVWFCNGIIFTLFIETIFYSTNLIKIIKSKKIQIKIKRK